METAINFKTNFQIKEAEQMLCILLLVRHVLTKLGQKPFDIQG
jgi:hypothetical protein